MAKHPIEDTDSWSLYLERTGKVTSETVKSEQDEPTRRQLRHHHHHKDIDPEMELEIEKEKEFQKKMKKARKDEEAAMEKLERKRREKVKELWADSGIRQETVHGMMIDAGSTGSRMHMYEFNPRVLKDAKEVQNAVAGKLLSFPGTDSRWTERLKPGLGTFASLPDDELLPAVAEYLDPLLDFAKNVLHTKQDEFETFPIFLKATAGMRILDPIDRSRVINAVRTLFANETYCPFWFEEERVRVISGEEEAIYGWTGVNFLMGTLLEDSAGAGTVSNPRLTYGAMDMGGASTQISFYEPDGDIMANLFKLQIGQGKHWNVYAHSFLYYGINEAGNRLGARLVSGRNATERLVHGIHNPCLPGGAKKEIRTAIHLEENGMETWDYESPTPSVDGFYQAILRNDNDGGDFDGCLQLAYDLLHKESNEWCEFAHKGACSFHGIYQPELPRQSEHFGEFLGVSNFYHVADFLGLRTRFPLEELKIQSRHVCSMSEDELIAYNNGKVEEDELNEYCFRSAYIYQILRNGYGFQDDTYITAAKVINGQKVGWALGSMLYEINTLPWAYKNKHDLSSDSGSHLITNIFVCGILSFLAAALLMIFRRKPRKDRGLYQPIKSVQV